MAKIAKFFWFFTVKKNLWCRYFHTRYRCYPVDTKYWHCSSCVDCFKHDTWFI